MPSLTTFDDDYKITCDYSGFVCWRSECVVQWDGHLVRKDFAELERHPQDKLPVAKEKPFTGIVRNEPPSLPKYPLLTVDQMI